MKISKKIIPLIAGFSVLFGIGASIGFARIGECAPVSAESETISFTAGFDEWAGSDISKTLVKGDVTLVVNKNSSSSNFRINNSDGHIRIYKYYSMEIKVPTVCYIESLVFTAVNNSYAAVLGNSSNWSNDAIASSSDKIATITASGTSTTSLQFTAADQTRVTSLKVNYVSNPNAPKVTINSEESNVLIDDQGTLTATTINATNPVVTWTSSNTDVLTIDSSTGEYTALNFGKTTITATLNCDEGTAFSTFDIVVNAGLITIAHANELCSGLADKQTTEYTVDVVGYLTDMDAQKKGTGKETAMTLSTKKVGETGGDQIMIYGIYSENALRSYAILNSTVRFSGKLQNYSGTLELTNPQMVAYTDDAIEYAKTTYSSLQASCDIGPEAVTDTEWNAMATSFNNLDEYAKNKLKAALTSDANEDIAKFIDRYERIVVSGKDNFMNKTIKASNYTIVSNNQSLMILVIGIIAGVSALGLVLFLTKKKHQ